MLLDGIPVTSTRRMQSITSSIPSALGWASLTVLGPMMLMKVLYKSCWHLFSCFIDLDQGLQGKIVLITGASSGLGEALAHVLYKRGCKLILASRNVDKLTELKKTLIESYHPPELHVPHVIKLDLEDLKDVPVIIDNAIKVNGHIDILVNNAGMSCRGEAATTDICVDVRLMIVNYFGQLAVTKAVLPDMKERKQGHIISISSVQGRIAIPHRSAYAASKHALQAFMDSLRAEVASDNINVSVISPGYINTKLSSNALTANGQPYAKVDKTTAEGMSAKHVAERVVQCMRTKDKEVLICPWSHRLAICLRTLSPSLFFFIMKLRASKAQ